MQKKRCMGCMQPISDEKICPHCGHDQSERNGIHQLPAGTILRGQYLVGAVLGQGGFGITYLGWDQSLDVPVAIKEFFPNGLVARDHTYSTEVIECEIDRQDAFHNSRARFLREAKILARFSDNPQIVHVRNFFEENNTAYIIMEYVQGKELRQYVVDKGGKLDAQETLSILRPLIRAMAQVHKLDLIHRDISPDNIMLLPGAGIKLLDFGAARDVEGADAQKELPKSTEAILKHGFAPMEQYQKRGSLGPWTDVYALCATAYFCMTGKVPPDAPARMMENIHPDWRSIQGLTAEQIFALEQGMAMKPKDRTSSVELLYEQLYHSQNARSKENTSAAKERSSHRKKKDKKGFAIIVAGAVIMCLCFGGYIMQKDNVSQPQQLQVPTSETTLPAVTAIITEATIPTEETEVTTVPTLPTEVVETRLPETEQTEPAIQAVEELTKTWNYSDDAWKNNVLASLSPPDTMPDKTGHAVFGMNVPRRQIQSITFLDNYADAPDNARDISSSGNRSVLAWLVQEGDLYDLYIGAPGGLDASSACKKLFQGYCNLKTINFGISFHTDNAISFANMFDGCSSLETINVGCFKSSKVSDMSSMFAGCESLKQINISNFDTSNVMYMTSMFENCPAEVTVSLDNFNTEKTTRYRNFMEEGRLINGIPWEELFQNPSY